MKNRPFVQRSLLRRAVRKQIVSANPDRRGLIRWTLENREIFEVFYEQAINAAANSASSTGEFTIARTANGQAIADNLLKLFSWFVENGPELIRLIERIAELFGSSNLKGTS